MDERDERIAKNEAVFRAANRELEQADKEAGVGSGGQIEVLCECGLADCGGVITMTIAEYDDIHAERDRFVILPGHENPEVESVVERRDAYLVVDKFGE